MSETTTNIRINAETWIDIYSESTSSIAFALEIQNTGTTDLYYAVSEIQPSKASKKYKIFRRGERIITNANDFKFWIFSTQIDGLVNVEVLISTRKLEQTAYGSLSVEQLSPITQISAQDGLRSDVFVITNSGGSNSVVDEKYTCETGLSAGGLASILTLRQLSNRSGQGSLATFTALFDTPTNGADQVAGLITGENLLVFGYIGTFFGIVHGFDGHDELQELTLTVAGGAENVTVTVDGTGYTVALSGAGTVEDDAYEIAVSLNSQIPDTLFTSNEDQVVAQAGQPRPYGSFAYSSAGTSIGSWTQLLAGKLLSLAFIPQFLWNVDTRLTGTVAEILNPQFGNTYKIVFDYDFGLIKFSVKDANTGSFALTHIIKNLNASTLGSMNSPVFRIGWLVRNTGNTSNVMIQGGVASAFIEGKVYRDGPARAISNNQLNIGTTLTNILSLRNRSTMGDKVNRNEIFPLLITASTQAGKFAFFKLLANPTFGANVVWEYHDKDNSIAETTFDSVPISGGSEIGTVTIVTEDSGEIRFNITLETNTYLIPGSVFTLAAVVPSGASNDCQGSFTWQEDF